MANEPTIQLTGNVGGDPELRFTPSGKAVCNLSVAVTPSRKVGDEWQDGDTMWFRIAVWDRAAENTAEVVRKGDRVLINGLFHQGSYTGSDGHEKSTLEITARNVAVIPKALTGQNPAPARTQAGQDPWRSNDDQPPF